MFLLICVKCNYILRICYFNTSHVSINPIAVAANGCGRNISIHPMFLLIKMYLHDIYYYAEFQYIPCFY